MILKRERKKNYKDLDVKFKFIKLGPFTKITSQFYIQNYQLLQPTGCWRPKIDLNGQH